MSDDVISDGRDTDNKTENQAGGSAASADMQPPMIVHAQYIRDLSVENPHAPLSLRNMTEAPFVNMSINVNARPIEDKDAGRTFHEVILSLSVTAKHGDQVSMIIELEYGLACTINDMPDSQLHPFLLIEVPHMMFPFVRQIVADLTAHAGFNPIYLAPFNFRALYLQRFAKARQGEEAEAPAPTVDVEEAAG